MSPEPEEILEGGEGNEEAVGEAVEEEEDEELVVVEGDTVVDPGAVMIHLENTGPADGAVVGPVRLDHGALLAVPHGSLQKEVRRRDWDGCSYVNCSHGHGKVLIYNDLLQESSLILVIVAALHRVQLLRGEAEPLGDVSRPGPHCPPVGGLGGIRHDFPSFHSTYHE